MPSFLSICLTLLRIAICATHVIQGLLIELHNAVEWLRDEQYSPTTVSTEDQSSNPSLTEPSSSDAVNTDNVAPSTHSIGSSDFTEVSSTRKVFKRLNRQSTLSEPEKNSESLILVGGNIEHNLEDYRYSKQPVARSGHFDTAKEKNSSKFQENEMSKSSRNEPAASITTSENVSVSEEPTEVMPVETSPNSDNAVEESEIEASNEPAVYLSANQAETTPSEKLRSSAHSIPSAHNSQMCVSSEESNIDSVIAIKSLSERTLYETKLESKKVYMDVNIERHLQFGDYDMSTLRETQSNFKSPGSSNEKSIGKQDIDLQGTHLPLTPSPPKKMSGRTLVKVKEDSFIPAALDQSLCVPLYHVDISMGNTEWKTDMLLESISEKKGSSPYENDSKTTAASYNKQELKCEFQETSTTKEILCKPIRDRVSTPPLKFPIAESSTDNEYLEDTLSKSYHEYTGAPTAQSEYKPVCQRRQTPAARFPNRLSTDTEEENGARYDLLLDFRTESPTMAEVEFKSTCERKPTTPQRIMQQEQTSSSGTDSTIFSEPNNLAIFVPLREESRPLALSSPLNSEESSQYRSVGFIELPLLTKNDRIDSMEKIEFAIKPSCEFIPPEAIVFPQTLSQISSPTLTDSDTPENVKYIEKASQLLVTVSTYSDKEQEYCDINSSATEFPISGSQSATESEDALESGNLPQLLVESPQIAENEKRPSKECNAPSVRFLLPESHIERECKGIRKESKIRKPPNETSTSEEENEIKVSRKRRASPGKFYKSPKKFAETTASKIRGYTISPQKVSNEKYREERSTSENTSANRSLDFELGIQQKSLNAADLPTSVDQKNLELESEKQLSPRIIEDQVIEVSNSLEATSKSDESPTGSKSETTSSMRVGDDIALDPVPESTKGIFSQIGTDYPTLVADCMVDSSDNGSDSTLESTKGLFPSITNETLALQGIANEKDSTFKDDESNDILVKCSTDSDKPREISFTGNTELLDILKSSQKSKCLEIEELPIDQNNEETIDQNITPQSEFTSRVHALSEGEQHLNCNLKLGATDPTSNDESSHRSTSSESTSSDETINEKSGSDSSYEGAAGLASQQENRTEFAKSSNADGTADKNSTEGKSDTSELYSSDKSTDTECVKNSTLKSDSDNFIVHKNIKNYINLSYNADGLVEIDTTLKIGESQQSAGVDELTELVEELSNSSHPSPVESRSDDQINETEQQLEMELHSFNEASFSTNRISALSPIYEVSANGTASSHSYSESEMSNAVSLPSASSASEEECVSLEKVSPLSESKARMSPKNGHDSSDPKHAFSNLSQISTSEGKNIQLNTTSLNPAKLIPRIGKGTGEINSETETVSPLSSLNKSSSSEVDANTVGKVTEGTTGYQLSTLNTQLKKDHEYESYFSPVLEELVQRIKSASRSNSPTKNPSFLYSPVVEDGTKVSSDFQHSTALKTKVKKVYNVKNYFDPVLKELVQRVKSSAVSDSLTSIKTEKSSVPKIEISSNISIQTSPRKDLMTDESASILELSDDILQNVNEAEMKNVVETLHSDSLITGAEEIEQDNLEFELHIVPQPVPCEIPIESKVEVLISNEASSDQSEIKIVDSKTPESELNAPDKSSAESTSCQLTSNPEKSDDSFSRTSAIAVSNESTTVEMLASTENLNSVTSSTAETFFEVTMENSFSTEKVLRDVTKDDPSEITLETINKYYTENILNKVNKECSTENMDVEIKKEGSTESNLVDVSKDGPTAKDIETTNSPHGSTFIKMENDSNEIFAELMHDCSSESSVMNTSTNLDSSIAEEIDANDKE